MKLSADPIRLAAKAKEKYSMSGMVKKVKRTAFGSQVEMNVNKMSRRGREKIVNSNIVVMTNRSVSKRLEGKGIKIFCKLALPDGDFERFYLARGVVAQGRTDYIEREVSYDGPFWIWLARVKKKVRDLLAHGLPHESGALNQGIVLGEREEIDASIEEDFRRTATSHILAVSGENLALLFVFCLVALGTFSVPTRTSYLICIPIGVFYSALTGFEPSVMRALVTGSLGLYASYLGRLRNGLDLLSIALIGLLGLNPYLLYHVGFQLSFAAAASLVILTPKILERFCSLPRMFAIIFASTIAAQLGVAPILAYHFNQISLVGLIANLFVLPVVGWILPVGIASMVFGWLSPGISWVLNVANLPLLEYLLLNARLLSGIPGAAVSLAKPTFVEIFIYYSLLFVAFRFWERFRLTSFRIFCCVLLVLNFLVISSVLPEKNPSDLRVEFFYVGEGDSALISTPDGRKILIDGGPDKNTVLSRLQSRRIKSIDLMVLTHPHADHLNGLILVARKYRIGAFLSAGDGRGSQYRSLMGQLERDRVKLIKPKTGDSFRLGSDLFIKVIAMGAGGEELNERSLVLKLSYKGSSILFPGDAEKSLGSIADSELRCDVLKVSHHGSYVRGMNFLLAKMKPAISVISVGIANQFNHPARSTVRALMRVSSLVLRTDRCGDIELNKTGNGFVFESNGF